MSIEAGSEQNHFTRDLSDYLAAVRFDELPERVVHEARRGVLDWLGCAVAGSTHPTVNKLIALLLETGGRQSHATAIARNTMLGLLDAPLANGVMSHVLDYDDTYMTGTVLHASSPTLAAAFALAEREQCNGKQLLLSYIVGFEAAVRVARAVPDHHKSGWHATGTLGAIAAGVAAGKLLGLDSRRLACAMGIAATQSAGLLENRDSACKALHAGKAASNGVLAGLLAAREFDSAEGALGGKQGFCRVYGTVTKLEALTDSLGRAWAMENNGYKPFACAIGLHPVIEAVMAIRTAKQIDSAKIERVELRVNSYLSRYRSIGDSISGHHSKFSVYHSAAVALIDGAGGAQQFTDERAFDPAVTALSRKVSVEFDDSIQTDQASACIVTSSGRHELTIDHATGTVRNPMTDEAIEAKFYANAEPVIGAERSRRISDSVWTLEKQSDVRNLISLCA